LSDLRISLRVHRQWKLPKLPDTNLIAWGSAPNDSQGWQWGKRSAVWTFVTFPISLLSNIVKLIYSQQSFQMLIAYTEHTNCPSLRKLSPLPQFFEFSSWGAPVTGAPSGHAYTRSDKLRLVPGTIIKSRCADVKEERLAVAINGWLLHAWWSKT